MFGDVELMENDVLGKKHADLLNSYFLIAKCHYGKQHIFKSYINVSNNSLKI